MSRQPKPNFQHLPLFPLILWLVLSQSGCNREDLRELADRAVAVPRSVAAYAAAERPARGVSLPAVKDEALRNDVMQAELSAGPAGRAVLAMGRRLAWEEKAIVRGSCWNWVNTVYDRAGYGENKYYAYKSRFKGPYVDLHRIQPGDWLYYVNHSYRNVEHSGIFVYWLDRSKGTAIILSYGGEGRGEPGRYRPYDIRHTYMITRPGRL